jgi:hypothetical protein
MAAVETEKQLYEVLANVADKDTELFEKLMAKIQTKDFDKDKWD